MASNPNQTLVDEQVKRTVRILGVTKSITAEIEKLLDETEPEVRKALLADLADIDLASPSGKKKLDALLAQLDEIRQSAVDGSLDTWRDRLTSIGQQETDFLTQLYTTVSPVVVDWQTPAKDFTKQVLSKKPFEGRVLKDWADSMLQSELDRFKVAITKGLVQGQSIENIVRSIIGSRTAGGADGITNITRRDAKLITRTAVNFVTSEIRSEFYDQNSDVLSKEMFVATLDARTTRLCASLDGNVYDIGKGPQPPLHFGCRSVRVALIGDKIVGKRPFNAATEKQLLAQYAKENGLTGITSRDDLPHGTKTKFDTWARKQARQDAGQVPADTTYQEWLKRQKADFQDEVLGPTKGKLFRNGGLTVKDFVDPAGNVLTLDELAAKYAEAFVQAGLR